MMFEAQHNMGKGMWYDDRKNVYESWIDICQEIGRQESPWSQNVENSHESEQVWDNVI